MDSSYQVHETHYADMSLSVHDRINDLHRTADRLALRVAEEALDSGCTNLTVREHGQLGPRQRKAWDMVAEAHGWNAISDDPELVAEAEQYERDGTGYKVGYGPDGFGIMAMTVTEPARPKTVKLEILDQDGAVVMSTGERPASEARSLAALRMRWLSPRRGHDYWARVTLADRTVRTYGEVPQPEIVRTGQLRVGDVVLTHGMRVRIDAVNQYGGGHGGAPAWSCPGTVLSLAEVLAAKIIPAHFLTTEKWEDGRGWVTDRNDHWTIQGNDLARWAVERPRPEAPADPEPTGPEPHDEAETADLFVTADDGHGTRSVLRDGEVVVFIRWSGDVLKVYFPGGTILGRLYRSDGKRVAGEIIYTYRAWTASDRLECRPTDTEVARGASLPGAVAALLQHAADAHRQAEDQADEDPEPYTINGSPACGAPVDGGRCGRHPHYHDGQPHIKEPGTES